MEDNNDWEEIPTVNNDSDWEEVTEVTPQSSPLETLTEAAKMTAGGAVGGATGYGLGKGLNAGIEAVINATGDLTPDQVQHIKSDPTTYKAAPSLESMLDEWKRLSQGVQQTGISSAGQARESLKGLPNIPSQSIYEALSVEPSNIKYSTPIDVGTKDRIIQEQLGMVRPDIEAANLRGSEIEQQLAKLQGDKSAVVVDPALNLRQSHLDEKLELNDKLSAEKLNQLQQANERAYARNVAQEGVNPSQANFQGYGADERIGFNANQSAQKSELTAKQAQERLDLQKMTKEEQRLLKLEKEIQKLNAEKAKLGDKSTKAVDKALDKAKDEYAKLSNFPKEINAPTDRYLRPEYTEQLEAALAKIRPAQNVGIEPIVADQMLQELRQGINFDGQSDRVKDFNKGLSETFRQQVLGAENFPEYDEGMKRSSAAQRAQEAIEGKSGIRYDKSPENISFGESGHNKLTKLLADPQNADRAELIRELGKAEEAGVLPKGVIEQFFRTGDSSVIKDIVAQGDLSKAGRMNLTRTLGKAGVGATLGGLFGSQTGAGTAAGTVAGTTAGLLAEKYRNQLQEMAALGKDSKVTKVARNILPGALGTAGAFLGAAGAASAGELTPEEAAVAGVAEAANPIPMTDVVSGLVEAKQAGNEALQQAEAEGRDLAFEQDIAQTGDLGAAPSIGAVTSNPIDVERLKGFAKGFVSPISDLGGMAVDALESWGRGQSVDARKRMEQRFAPTQKNVQDQMLEDSKELNKASPVQLQELADSFKQIKGAERFVAPLENAAQSSTEEEKNARLFGLYQQPAFRQLLKKDKIEG